jgi:hypothetical protein
MRFKENRLSKKYGANRTSQPRFLQFCLFILGVFSDPHLVQSDGTTTITLEGIQYNATDDISVKSKKLVIGPKKIKVFYVFKNHTDQDITSEVSFPLPPVGKRAEFGYDPKPDPLYDCYDTIDKATRLDSVGDRSQNQGIKDGINLKVAHQDPHGKVRPIRTYLQVRAIDHNNKDITDQLRQLGIPISAAFVKDTMRLSENGQGLGNHPEEYKALRAKLKKLNLLDSWWDNTATYVWQDTFPAKKDLHVYHSYNPLAGSSLDPSRRFAKGLHLIEGSGEPFIKDEHDEEGWKKFSYRFSDYSANVSYILSTGGPWKNGVIKDFTLVIKRGDPKSFVATNFPGTFKKNKEGDYVCHIKNYRPQQEPLRVAYLYEFGVNVHRG